VGNTKSQPERQEDSEVVRPKGQKKEERRKDRTRKQGIQQPVTSPQNLPHRSCGINEVFPHVKGQAKLVFGILHKSTTGRLDTDYDDAGVVNSYSMRQVSWSEDR